MGRRRVRPAVHQPTVGYFDHHVPEYSPRRLARAVELIDTHVPAGASLVDVGCGAGSVMAHLAARTRLARFTGLDVSTASLDRAARAVDAELHRASILDPATVRRFGGRFDVAVMAAVLHHLVGPTRRSSRRAAATAVAHAWRLLRPGGHLVVVEPTFAPAPPLTLLFWTKNLTSRVVDRRIPVGDYWNNIGPPVVSYYSHRDVRELVRRQPGATVVHAEATPQPLTRLAGAVLTKTGTTVMARRAAAAD
jgi:SAM-dependent methyltransferase